jgi:flagellar hook-basal body complex protein FliE
VADLLNKVGQIVPSELKQKNDVKITTDINKDVDESFADVLKKTIEETNTLQLQGDKASVDIATGQVKDLHQAAIAIDKAETSMKFMLEVRNKAISAYKEILRTQM